MTRLISATEMQENRLKCKDCKKHIAFTRDDLLFADNEYFVICPLCANNNTVKYVNIDSRNVIDEYKNLSTEEIKERLKENALPYSILFEHWQHDMNIGGVFRSSNAFGAREVFYIGEKRFDKRGMLGIQNYTDIHYIASIKELIAYKSQYKIIAVDNIVGSKSINDYKYPINPMFCFGSEAEGLSKELLDIADERIYIPQMGSVRSLNCSVAAGIIMHDYTTKYLANK